MGIRRLTALHGPPPGPVTPPGRRVSLRSFSATDAAQPAAQIKRVQVRIRHTGNETAKDVAVALFCTDDQIPPRVYETKG